jgi:hypothetical protein
MRRVGLDVSKGRPRLAAGILQYVNAIPRMMLAPFNFFFSNFSVFPMEPNAGALKYSAAVRGAVLQLSLPSPTSVANKLTLESSGLQSSPREYELVISVWGI